MRHEPTLELIDKLDNKLYKTREIILHHLDTHDGGIGFIDEKLNKVDDLLDEVKDTLEDFENFCVIAHLLGVGEQHKIFNRWEGNLCLQVKKYAG